MRNEDECSFCEECGNYVNYSLKHKLDTLVDAPLTAEDYEFIETIKQRKLERQANAVVAESPIETMCGDNTKLAKILRRYGIFKAGDLPSLDKESALNIGVRIGEWRYLVRRMRKHNLVD